ncbi:MAG: nucleotidyl transferase AbiEii/AbiGii toxin family protein [Deltaproteobacteria bacterium]|nr:nucleotidyl transferase AbiEii/AbiGii toxin family protein [Deltaproteobacteria bacterium]
MTRVFDRRVLPAPIVAFLRDAQQVAPAHLGGGAALSGAHLAHRLSGDLDLFVHDRAAHRLLVSALPDLARDCHASLDVRQDAGIFVRASMQGPAGSLLVDVIYEPATDLAPAEPVEGVLCESLVDLRASKLTCLLSRTEPRDLVDVLFLERAGYLPEDDLDLGLRKDAGLDPAVLAWLLSGFRVEPLPTMLVPLDADTLRRYRDDLAARLRALAQPPP